ncbi:hypothetical protein [Pedobacter sp. UYP24]
MKGIKMILFIVVVLAACTQKEDYKKVREEVMGFHNLVMDDQEKIVSNQMKLDTLLKTMSLIKLKIPSLDTNTEKAQIHSLLKALADADDRMNNWMQQFEPDVSGKSDQDAVDYFKKEEVKIKDIDSMYKNQLKISDSYLLNFKKLRNSVAYK